MSKKILSMLLVVVMIVGSVFALSSCNPDEEGIKAALICLHGDSSTYDKNFIDAFKEACANKGLTEDDYTIVTDIDEDTACYDKAADCAKKAHTEGTSLKAAVLSLGYLSEEEFDSFVKAEKMV